MPENLTEQVLDSLDELQDIRAYDRTKASPQEFVPAALVDRLIAGESPVKVWREHRGLTQQVLADKTGISKPFLSQIENERRGASVDVLKRLAAALGIDLDDLA